MLTKENFNESHKLRGMEVEGVDTCMLKEYLEKKYGYNEPIFLNEIRLEGLSDNALRQYFKQMLGAGDLARFDTGIYYLPKVSRLLKKSYLDPMKVIIRKYIQSTTESYGYFAGATFANQIGLTTQMPAVLEIATSKESIKKFEDLSYFRFLKHRKSPLKSI